MNPCNNKQNRGFSVKGNRHVGWPREWDWQSGWRSQWQMMRLEQSRIACNPCEDGLKYKQKRRRRRRKRRYTAVCVTKLWCWKNWDSTRRSQLFAKFKPDQITIQRLRAIWRERRLNVTVWKCFRGDRTGWRRFESTLWKTWVWRTGEMNNDPGWMGFDFSHKCYSRGKGSKVLLNNKAIWYGGFFHREYLPNDLNVTGWSCVRGYRMGWHLSKATLF